MILKKLKEQLLIEEPHDKDSFWASDVEKNSFDIYHRWLGTEPTNPIEPETQIIFTSGKMIEQAIVKSYFGYEPEEQDRIEIEREGVPITGYLDTMIDGVPVEIKTFYGDYQEKDLEAGNARISYLKQLAIYMDAKDKDKGVLLYFHRGTGRMFEFILERKGNVFTCGKISFDITDEYKRFSKIYKENIVPKREPASDFVYKYPVETVKWKEIPKHKISKARNGHAVLGDWQVLYSNYKEMIVKKEASRHGKTLNEYLGYSQAELDKIKALTSGYSNW